MCRPPENPANIRKHTARRSVPANFVGCVFGMRFIAQSRTNQPTMKLLSSLRFYFVDHVNCIKKVKVFSIELDCLQT